MVQKKIPKLILKKRVVLPNTITELDIKRDSSILTVKESKEKFDNSLIVFVESSSNKKYGVLSNIIKFDDENGISIVVQGISRVEIIENELVNYNKSGEIEISSFKEIKEKLESEEKIKEIKNEIIEVLINRRKDLPFEYGEEEVIELKETSYSEFIDRFSFWLPVSELELLPLVGMVNIYDRYKYVYEIFSKITESIFENVDIKEAKDGVQKRVQNRVQSQQKEYYLREQIRAAQAELDELTGNDNEFEKYRKRVDQNPYPKHIKDKLLSEIRKLEQTPSQAQEANITRTYIEWLLDLPYWKKDKEIIDIKKAKKILDNDHYGLEKPKSRIIEFLAVKQQNPEAKGSILALVGPPGTGKTTMVKSISNALGRKLIKIALGGVKDEAEIRGHRRTYIASQPGKIIQGMKKSGVINPIILLDEIDKMSADFKGDPTSAMLEVLDYEQNSFFQDHYLEEEYDLSNVTFIATANYFQNIPEALIDRLDIVEVSSYTELEKIKIFKNHLYKRIIEETKIPKSIFKWDDSSVRTLIRHYTMESGVRQLHREANTIARKILVKKFNNELESDKLKITSKYIEELLGPKKYNYTKIDKKPQIGTVSGLAWTQYGGDILPIEVNIYSGKGEVVITGQLKDVMRESATIAISYIKANSKNFEISEENLRDINEKNLHIHSPDGATPKDGPSAGVTFTTALISAITKKPVSQYIGMTGEISLRGHILPIGGLKEKLISAYRSGLKTIFIPKENVKDLIDIPSEVKDNLEIIPVERYIEIYERIFKK